jgi:hypothetical protein
MTEGEVIYKHCLDGLGRITQPQLGRSISGQRFDTPTSRLRNRKWKAMLQGSHGNVKVYPYNI